MLFKKIVYSKLYEHVYFNHDNFFNKEIIQKTHQNIFSIYLSFKQNFIPKKKTKYIRKKI